MKMLRRILSVGLLACTAAAVAQGSTADDAQKDPVLKAMLAELERSRQELQLQGFARPFFIEYRIDDVTNFDAQASYGALTNRAEQHHRIARVIVRVGDYKLDSSAGANGRGDGSVQLATTENDPLAIRYALWSATDTAYKAALREYTQKQAALKSVQTPPSANDFSEEKPVISLEPTVKLELNEDAWTKQLVEATGLYRSDQAAQAFEQEVQYSNGRMGARATNRYIVNSEGTIVRKASSQYLAAISVGGQAPDGMRIERSYGTTGVTAAQLDSPEKFRNGVLGILISLHQLHAAPVIADEYHGPVLFSGDASSDIFEELFADPIAAVRPELGTTERTRGPYQSSYQTRVLPEFFKVTDDPGMTTFDGKGLLGSYRIDDQGVPAQAVNIVDQGKLVNYVIGREPVKDFPTSNGHGRASIGGAARPEIGVLHVEASKTSTPEEMKQKLAALGKDEGLDNVYAVDTFGPELAPRLLYRVNVASGQRQLVRGATLDDLDQRTLRSGIRAAGNDTYVDNVIAEPPAAILAPSLLVDDITVKRADQRNDKLPYYPPPD